jgi:hypothetical protein
MHVELLVVPDCPQQAGATSLLRTTLDEPRFENATIDTTVIDTVEAAQQRGPLAPPTLLVNGTDALPAPAAGGPLPPPHRLLHRFLVHRSISIDSPNPTVA